LFYGISEGEWPVKQMPVINDLKIAVYPNPAQDWLYVQSEKEGRMQGEILDLQGRVIRLLPSVKNGQRIDVSAFPAGSYVLKIVVDNQIYALKFIKNR